MKDFHQVSGNFDPHKLPFMSSIYPTIVIICLYFLSLRLGQGLMKHRRPFQLKAFLVVYNILQVLACLYFLINVFRTGFKWNYLWTCHMTGYENLNHVKLLYFTYILKGTELIETILFILRKKFGQMSFLHIYHHVSTFVFAYIGVTRVGNGMLLTPYTLNMIVHAVMYSYYLASIFISDFDKIISVKKSITIMQMVQFILILFNTVRAYQTECGIETIFVIIFIPNVLIIFYEFFKFYTKTYSKSGKKKAKQVNKKKSY
ncbi:CLUMA_CG011614, isoform A [Clunio marinus]|uniref:Elongation of very long chain fatty acids protein n=1 Tax=Clunio marinus TaxID=568069 RepID=A0A1J1IFC4_9DIPT|nr:CLUMA_CG011614, isoform A [Clunio marinus]